jgi:nucleoid-associated protein YgaU
MTLLVAAVIVALVGAGLVIHPIVSRRAGLMTDAVSGGVVDRETRKRIALAALKEVEYDHAAGKLDDNDYRAMRSQLELEALTAVKAAEAETALDTTVAHACGFVNPAGSRFCAGCGKRLA